MHDMALHLLSRLNLAYLFQELLLGMKGRCHLLQTIDLKCWVGRLPCLEARDDVVAFLKESLCSVLKLHTEFKCCRGERRDCLPLLRFNSSHF